MLLEDPIFGIISKPVEQKRKKMNFDQESKGFCAIVKTQKSPLHNKGLSPTTSKLN